MTGQCWKSWGCEDCREPVTITNQCNSRFSACEGDCAMCGAFADADKIVGPCYDKNGVARSGRDKRQLAEPVVPPCGVPRSYWGTLRMIDQKVLPPSSTWVTW
jgi:hypothetical protein